jgi:2'-5' RNA ligase
MTADRLFFALWPDSGLSAALARQLPALAHGLNGKPQRPDQWHVTLEFLGSVPVDRQPAAWAAADYVVAEPFHVEFDLLDHWRKPQVLCLSASCTPAALATLVAQLRAALGAQGFMPDQREYRPHVTLARKVRTATTRRLDAPIDWPADRFALVRSVTDPAGSRYEPLRWWNLRSASARETGSFGQ